MAVKAAVNSNLYSDIASWLLSIWPRGNKNVREKGENGSLESFST